jgi:hypothetical protein
MTEETNAAETVERRARHSDLLDWLVRAGLVSYGVLHLLLAWVSVRLVAGHHGSPSQGGGSGSATGQGALAQLAGDSLGRILLTAMGAMFVGLAVWQLVAALVGYRRDDGWQRHVMRIGALCRVLAYAYFAFAAARLALQGTAGSGRSPESTTARVMHAPAGPFLLVAAGLVAAGTGIGLTVFGLRRGFVDQLDGRARDSERRLPIVVLGQVGYVAKGLAFVVIGVLLALAAVTRNADKTGGLDESLYQVLGHAWGGVAIVVVGVGIGCFGLFLFARAWHLNQRTLTS